MSSRPPLQRTADLRLHPRSGFLYLGLVLVVLFFWILLSAHDRTPAAGQVRSWFDVLLAVISMAVLLSMTWVVGAFPRTRLATVSVSLGLLGLLLALELSATSHIMTVLWGGAPLSGTAQLTLDVLGGLGVVVTMVTSWRAVERSWEQIRADEATDHLTGWRTRSGFTRALSAHASASGTLMLVDINRLKWINDQYGHAAGDEEIRKVSQALDALLPPTALKVRWGGDELLAIIFQQHLLEVGKGLRHLQDRLPSLFPGQSAFVFGLARMDASGDLAQSLAVADHELYLAKGSGEVSSQAYGEERGLFEFSRRLEQLQTPESIIQEGLKLCRQLLQFEVAAYSQVNGLEYQSLYLDHEPDVTFEVLRPGSPRTLSGLGLEAVSARRTVVSVDYLHDPLASSTWQQAGTKSMMLTPVERAGTVVGVLTMVNVSTWKAMPLRSQRVLELAALRLGHALDLQLAIRTVRQTMEGGLLGLGIALEARDLETKGHTERVVHLSDRLGTAMNLAPAALDELRQGASLHDIGKLTIPDQILLKTGPLDPEEWRVMQTHAAAGAAIAGYIPNLATGALGVIQSHHERWDGHGYPQQLTGEEIPLLARIFAVCDVYDALISERPYKRAWTVEAARAELLAQAGRQFDPRVVTAFLELEREDGAETCTAQT